MNKLNLDNTFMSTLNTARNMDYGDIEASMGNIQKYTGYENLTQSILLIREISRRTSQQIEELNIVELALSNLEKYRNDFERGFKLNDHLTILLYNNVVAALIASTSFIISSCLDYIKNPSDESYSIFIKNTKQQNYKENIFFIKNLSRFNNMCISGDISRVFNSQFNKSVVNRNMVETGTLIFCGIGLAAVIIPLLQEIVYQIYATRISISDYLKMQSEFVELNQRGLEDLENKKKRTYVKSKQTAVAKNLTSLADKIDVDIKSSNNQAKREIQKSSSQSQQTISNTSSSNNLNGMV